MYSLNRLPRSAAFKSSANLLRRNASTTSAGGVNVVGFENKGPAATSSLTVAIKAGSRYETTPGVAHVLKSFAYKATASASALRTAREAELYGGVLSAALTREHLLLSAEFLRGDEEHFLNVLASVLSSSQFYRHELSELVLPVVEAETISSQAIPSTIALDLAHSLAFRRGLGNSLYANKNYPVSIDDVKSFGEAAFAKSNIAVIGTGVSTEALAKAVSNAFGAGTSVKWTPGASPLAQAADKIPGASAKAFLLPYSDAALFGVVLSAPTSAETKTLAQEVASIVKNAGEFKEEEVKRAVAKATFEDAASTETLSGFVAAAGPAALVGSVPEAQSFSGVSASSISKAAGELLKGKPTVVSIGNISVLPYADELGL
ncbi:hypothetical protein AYX14_04277 [Cryptococcus neoformans]|nr:hypothetical protein AYX14_04277 [Cryptococcus neoformans var. grubii]